MMAYEKTSFEVENSQNSQLEKEKKEKEDQIALKPSMKKFSEVNDLLNKQERQDRIRSALAQKLRDQIQQRILRNRNASSPKKDGEGDSLGIAERSLSIR